MLSHTKKSLIQLLADNDITTSARSKTELYILAIDRGLISKDEILDKILVGAVDEPKVKRPIGRPRKHPPKPVDLVKDPKYDWLRNLQQTPVIITVTDVETGEVTRYKSQYKAWQR